MSDHRRRSPESSRRRRRARQHEHAYETGAPAVGMAPPSATYAEPQHHYQQQYQQPQSYQQYAQQHPHQFPQQYSAQYAQPQQPYQQHYTPQHTPQHQHTQPEPISEPIPTRSRAADSSSDLSSSSSTSDSLLNISAPKPRGGFFSFFTAPSSSSDSHRRKIHRKKKKKLLRFGNSSSSSVEEGLAYGRGYVSKSRLDVVAHREHHPQHQHSQPGAPHDPSKPAPPQRTKTDEEILEIGRKLAKMARDENSNDLARLGRTRPSQLVAAATTISNFRRQTTGDRLDRERGIGSSKPHRGSGDESEWETSSEDDDSFSDDGLAYGGSTTALPMAKPAAPPPRPAAFDRRKSSVVDPNMFGPVNSLRGLINTPCGFDDPAVKSTKLPVAEPRFDRPIPSVESASLEGRPLQEVYPMPTSDPTRFDAVRAQESAGMTSRPGPVPIQAPKPIVPISSRVYEAERYSGAEHRHHGDSHDDSKPRSDGTSFAGAAVAGLVGVGGVAMAAKMAAGYKDKQREEQVDRTDRREKDARRERVEPGDKYGGRPERDIRDDQPPRDNRKEGDGHRRREERYEQREDRPLRDDRRRSKRDSAVKIIDDRDARRAVGPDEKPARDRPLESDYSKRATEAELQYDLDRKRREQLRQEIVVEYDQDRDGRHRSSTHPKTGSKDEGRDKYRDEVKSEPRDERQGTKKYVPSAEAYQAERRVEDSSASSATVAAAAAAAIAAAAAATVTTTAAAGASTSPPAAPLERGPIDPFQFQVPDDAFPTPLYSTPKRPLTPMDTAPARPLTPMVTTVERVPDFSSFDVTEFEMPVPEARLSRRDSYEQEVRDAKRLEDATHHSTAPIPEAAIAAAVSAMERQKRRGRRGRDTEPKPTSETDFVQAEADRYYRESALARKIAEEEIRSRSVSPEPSVVERWHENEEPIVRIVTPPEMHRVHDKSIWEGPNADVRIDNVIEPKDLVKYRLPAGALLSSSSMLPIFRSRDPSAERERPMLNIVVPTPAPSPSPEKQEPRSAPVESAADGKQAGEEPRSAPAVIIGPRGEIIETPKDETKQVDDASRDQEKQKGKPKAPSGKKKSSGWGILAAAIAGAGAAAVASEVSEPKEQEQEKEGFDTKKDDSPERRKSREVERVDSPFDREPPSPPRSAPRTVVHGDLADDEPPAPGPKPSTRTSQMPGGFADDIDFAATLAAGLQDTGFDPNIVIDDPQYRRRDSPPGSDGPLSSYRQPFSETVTDLGLTSSTDKKRSMVDDPREAVSLEDDLSSTRKLSKKERRRLEKEAAEKQEFDAQGGSNEVPEAELIFKDNSRELPREILEEVATPEVASSTEAVGAGDDEWADIPTSKKKKKSRRNNGTAPAEIPLVPEVSRSESIVVVEAPTEDLADEEWAAPASSTNKGKKSKKAISSQWGDAEEGVSSIKVQPAGDSFGSRGLPKSEFVDVEVEDEDAGGVPAITKKKSKKSKKAASAWDDADEATTTSTPAETELEAATPRAAEAVEDDWAMPSTKKKGKKGKTSAYSWDDGNDASVSSTPVGTERDAPQPEAVEDDWTASSSRKKSKKGKKVASSRDDIRESSPAGERVSVPIDSLGDIPQEKQEQAPTDDWDMPRKSKKKSKRDSAVYDSPSRSGAPSEVSAVSSSRRSKNGRSKGEYTEEDTASKDYERDGGGEPPDRKRDRFAPVDRDVSSVVSDPMRYDDRYERRSNGSRVDEGDDNDTKSAVSLPTGNKQKSSAKQGTGFFGFFKGSNGTGTGAEDHTGEAESKTEMDDKDKQSFLGNAGTIGAGVGLVGALAAITSSASASNATTESSMASARAATEADVMDMAPATPTRPGTPIQVRDIPSEDVVLDPEILPRAIKPAIDPQYGDLLPLPPSEPSSPAKQLEEDELLPCLPESRPETPDKEKERMLLREKWASRRRSALETLPAAKSPSTTAIPLQFRLRSVPSSPSLHNKSSSSPAQSPAIPTVADLGSSSSSALGSATGKQRLSRPSSWDNARWDHSREIRPLYLPEHVRSGSQNDLDLKGLQLPGLPPSEPSEPSPRDSTRPEFEHRDVGIDYDSSRELPGSIHAAPMSLKLDTAIAHALEPQGAEQHLGSQDSTPKAEFAPYALLEQDQHRQQEALSDAEASDVFEDAASQLPSAAQSPDAERLFDDEETSFFHPSLVTQPTEISLPEHREAATSIEVEPKGLGIIPEDAPSASTPEVLVPVSDVSAMEQEDTAAESSSRGTEDKSSDGLSKSLIVGAAAAAGVVAAAVALVHHADDSVKAGVLEEDEPRVEPAVEREAGPNFQKSTVGTKKGKKKGKKTPSSYATSAELPEDYTPTEGERSEAAPQEDRIKPHDLAVGDITAEEGAEMPSGNESEIFQKEFALEPQDVPVDGAFTIPPETIPKLVQGTVLEFQLDAFQESEQVIATRTDSEDPTWTTSAAGSKSKKGEKASRSQDEVDRIDLAEQPLVADSQLVEPMDAEAGASGQAVDTQTQARGVLDESMADTQSGATSGTEQFVASSSKKDKKKRKKKGKRFAAFEPEEEEPQAKDSSPVPVAAVDDESIAVAPRDLEIIAASEASQAELSTDMERSTSSIHVDTMERPISSTKPDKMKGKKDQSALEPENLSPQQSEALDTETSRDIAPPLPSTETTAAGEEHEQKELPPSQPGDDLAVAVDHPDAHLIVESKQGGEPQHVETSPSPAKSQTLIADSNAEDKVEDTSKRDSTSSGWGLLPATLSIGVVTAALFGAGKKSGHEESSAATDHSNAVDTQALKDEATAEEESRAPLNPDTDSSIPTEAGSGIPAVDLRPVEPHGVPDATLSAPADQSKSTHDTSPTDADTALSMPKDPLLALVQDVNSVELGDSQPAEVPVAEDAARVDKQELLVPSIQNVGAVPVQLGELDVTDRQPVVQDVFFTSVSASASQSQALQSSSVIPIAGLEESTEAMGWEEQSRSSKKKGKKGAKSKQTAREPSPVRVRGDSLVAEKLEAAEAHGIREDDFVGPDTPSPKESIPSEKQTTELEPAEPETAAGDAAIGTHVDDAWPDVSTKKSKKGKKKKVPTPSFDDELPAAESSKTTKDSEALTEPVLPITDTQDLGVDVEPQLDELWGALSTSGEKGKKNKKKKATTISADNNLPPAELITAGGDDETMAETSASAESGETSATHAQQDIEMPLDTPSETEGAVGGVDKISTATQETGEAAQGQEPDLSTTALELGEQPQESIESVQDTLEPVGSLADAPIAASATEIGLDQPEDAEATVNTLAVPAVDASKVDEEHFASKEARQPRDPEINPVIIALGPQDDIAPSQSLQAEAPISVDAEAFSKDAVEEENMTEIPSRILADMTSGADDLVPEKGSDALTLKPAAEAPSPQEQSIQPQEEPPESTQPEDFKPAKISKKELRRLKKQGLPLPISEMEEPTREGIQTPDKPQAQASTSSAGTTEETRQLDVALPQSQEPNDNLQEAGDSWDAPAKKGKKGKKGKTQQIVQAATEDDELAPSGDLPQEEADKDVSFTATPDESSSQSHDLVDSSAFATKKSKKGKKKMTSLAFAEPSDEIMPQSAEQPVEGLKAVGVTEDPTLAPVPTPLTEAVAKDMTSESKGESENSESLASTDEAKPETVVAPLREDSVPQAVADEALAEAAQIETARPEEVFADVRSAPDSSPSVPREPAQELVVTVAPTDESNIALEPKAAVGTTEDVLTETKGLDIPVPVESAPEASDKKAEESVALIGADESATAAANEAPQEVADEEFPVIVKKSKKDKKKRKCKDKEEPSSESAGLSGVVEDITFEEAQQPRDEQPQSVIETIVQSVQPPPAVVLAVPETAVSEPTLGQGVADGEQPVEEFVLKKSKKDKKKNKQALLEAASKPADLPASGPAVEPVVESTTEFPIESTVELIPEPIVGPTLESLAESEATESFADTATEPLVVQTLAEPVIEPAVDESAADQLVEAATESAAEPVTTEPILETVAESVTAPITEPITETLAERGLVPPEEPEPSEHPPPEPTFVPPVGPGEPSTGPEESVETFVLQTPKKDGTKKDAWTPEPESLGERAVETTVESTPTEPSIEAEAEASVPAETFVPKPSKNGKKKKKKGLLTTELEAEDSSAGEPIGDAALETSVDLPVDTPVQVSSELLAHAAVEAAVETSPSAPADAPAGVTTQISDQTPFEAAVDAPAGGPSEAPAVAGSDAPLEAATTPTIKSEEPEEAEEPVETFVLKKPKKDKKRKKSGQATPLEAADLRTLADADAPAEPPFEAPVEAAVEVPPIEAPAEAEAPVEVITEVPAEPATDVPTMCEEPEELTETFILKESKKDKKKPQSSPTTPVEDTEFDIPAPLAEAPVEAAAEGSGALTEAIVEAPTEQPATQPGDSAEFFVMKKSKKDKKKKKSGQATPAESTNLGGPATSVEISPGALEESNAEPSLAEADAPMQPPAEAVVDAPIDHPLEAPLAPPSKTVAERALDESVTFADIGTEGTVPDTGKSAQLEQVYSKDEVITPIDEWPDTFAIKKSKKGKKRKQSAAWEPEAEPSSEATAEPASGIDTPLVEEASNQQAGDSIRNLQLQPGEQPQDERFEEFVPSPTGKKGKKGKKSKLLASAIAAAALTEIVAEAGLSKEEENKDAVRSTGHQIEEQTNNAPPESLARERTSGVSEAQVDAAEPPIVYEPGATERILLAETSPMDHEQMQPETTPQEPAVKPIAEPQEVKAQESEACYPEQPDAITSRLASSALVAETASETATDTAAEAVAAEVEPAVSTERGIEAVVQAEAEVDAEAAAEASTEFFGLKKSKKDKKKKKQSATEQLESETVISVDSSAEQSSLPTEAREFDTLAAAELTTADDTFEFGPAKKSKKENRKAKNLSRSQTLLEEQSEDVRGAQEAAMEPSVSVDVGVAPTDTSPAEVAAEPSVGPTVEATVSPTAAPTPLPTVEYPVNIAAPVPVEAVIELPVSDISRPSVDLPVDSTAGQFGAGEAAEEKLDFGGPSETTFEDFSMPRRSKKDKKRKGAKASDSEPASGILTPPVEEPSASRSIGPGQVEAIVTGEFVTATPTADIPATIPDAPFAGDIVPEEPSRANQEGIEQTDATAAVAEDEFTDFTIKKKSKKDKKKKGAMMQSDGRPMSVATTPAIQVPGASEAIILEPLSASATQIPSIPEPEPEPEHTSELGPESKPKEIGLTADQDDGCPVVRTKESKKDKKKQKKKQDQMQWDLEPRSGATSPTEEGGDPIPVVIPATEDLLPPGPAADKSEPVESTNAAVEPSAPETLGSDKTHFEIPAEVATAGALGSQIAASDAQIPVTSTTDSLTLTDMEDVSSKSDETPHSAAGTPKDLVAESSISKPALDKDVAAADANDEFPEFTVKKSKKGKKKKGAKLSGSESASGTLTPVKDLESTPQDVATTLDAAAQEIIPGASATDMQPSAIDTTTKDVESSNPTLEDNSWDLPAKKSKKSKKSKKQVLSLSGLDTEEGVRGPHADLAREVDGNSTHFEAATARGLEEEEDYFKPKGETAVRSPPTEPFSEFELHPAVLGSLGKEAGFTLPSPPPMPLTLMTREGSDAFLKDGHIPRLLTQRTDSPANASIASPSPVGGSPGGAPAPNRLQFMDDKFQSADLTPAQESSHISHEPPTPSERFTRPGKKARTFSIDDTPIIPGEDLFPSSINKGKEREAYEKPSGQRRSPDSESKPGDKSPPRSPPPRGETAKTAAAVGAAAAAAGGVAALAMKFGGSTRKTKGSKKKKIVDRRTSQEDDMFDDPSLWEGAERKLVEGSRGDQDSADFWEAGDSTVEDSKLSEPEVADVDMSGAFASTATASRGKESEGSRINAELDDFWSGGDFESGPERAVDVGDVDPRSSERSFKSTDLDENGRRGGIALHRETSGDTEPAESPILGRGEAQTYHSRPDIVKDSTSHDSTPRATPVSREHAPPPPSSPPPIAPGVRQSQEPSRLQHATFDETLSTSRVRGSAPMSVMAGLPDFDSTPQRSPEARELQQDIHVSPSIYDGGELRRSMSRILPPLHEEEEEEFASKKRDSHGSGHLTATPELNRDSGYMADSPKPAFQRPHFEGEGTQQRDSGVHLRDWVEDSPKPRAVSNFSPEPSRRSRSPGGIEVAALTGLAATALVSSKPERKDKDKQRVPPPAEDLGTVSRGVMAKPGTPRLREPAPQPRTPEPQKQPKPHGTSKKQSTYRELGVAAVPPAATAPAPAPATERTTTPVEALAAAAPIAAASTKSRSVSDNVTTAATSISSRGGQSSASPHSVERPVNRRVASNTSLARLRTPEPLNLRPDSPGSLRSYTGTPPLRRVDKRVSGDLRSLSQRGSIIGQIQPHQGDQPATTSTSKDSKDKDSAAGATTAALTAVGVVGVAAAAALAGRSSPNNTPVANEGRVRSAKDMADVYDGYGEGRIGSPRSPTRPPSMRRRQSMQVLQLENRVEQLAAENRMLSEARAHAEQALTQKAASILAERDDQIDTLKRSVVYLTDEVSRLTEVNEGLQSAISQASVTHNERYRRLEQQHADASRELEMSRGASTTHSKTLEEKDAEIERLQAQLEAAKNQIRELQQKILATKPADGSEPSSFLTVRDIDHFDHRCQQLCSHVQQWVLRFSKFSDMRACRLTSEINNEKIIDRLDNAVLDGSDVDRYLRDRVRRRDIFMSMTMTMIWEFVFTRYLFGMDREQRQKLKSLEKLLLEVGPPQAVRQWRAVTLTLLSRRDAFTEQKEQDTEAVVQAVLETLSMILPPPSNLEDQIQSQLRRVMREAVDLSVEMRTQRAEYMMLPPLQPQYDANGDLAETVTFNASLMSVRGGGGDEAATAEELEAEGATVRIVLFPLVVRKGDDAGMGDDEVVVCPAQVLVVRPGSSSRKQQRFVTPSSDAGGASLLQRGQTPTTPTPLGRGSAGANRSNVSMQEAEYLEGGI